VKVGYWDVNGAICGSGGDSGGSELDERARYQSPLLKAALDRAFKARTSEREGHANAPRYQCPRMRFTRAFLSLIACIRSSILPRNMRAPFLARGRQNVGTKHGGTFRTKHKHRIGRFNLTGVRREIDAPSGKIDADRETDQVNVATMKSRCTHYYSLITFFFLCFSIWTVYYKKSI